VGLIAYGAYIPYFRLQRGAIGAALGSGGGKGTRAVASYDEDTTSMGVEAARAALRGATDAGGAANVRALYFATANPAYADKTNATAIHAALGLDETALATDMAGAIRSGVGALWAAMDAREPTLVVLSDLRTGVPGSTDERDGGDAAAALLFGEGASLADVLGRAAVSAEFLDRWRIPGENTSHTWEERFGEHVYVPLARSAFDAALKDAGVAAGEIDHLVVTGAHARAVKAFAARAGVKAEALASDLTSSIGNTGTAQIGVLLADVLDRAQPGELIAAVTLADGASAFVLRATDALAQRRNASAAATTTTTAPTVAQQIAAGRDDLGYTTFLTWRGHLDREPPRRPDPVAPAPAPSYRMEDWKFGFTGSRCEACGARHLPPARVCVRCGAVDNMAPERLADVHATIATFTIDRLAYTLNPPLVAAVLDFDGGGRFNLELTDVDPASVAIGNRVRMTFRKIATAGGVHNYFWKARPLGGARANEREA
jgi:3-hydroxy-3-methylglutaryl CoA synthase/uncharacterized OB-fold protein